jgi:hypothetical protein
MAISITTTDHNTQCRALPRLYVILRSPNLKYITELTNTEWESLKSGFADVIVPNYLGWPGRPALMSFGFSRSRQMIPGDNCSV